MDVTTLRNLYEKQGLPPEGLMMSRPRSGLGDLNATMSRIASAMQMGTAAGDSAQGVRTSLGESSSVAANGTVGAGKARCPHMQGAGMKSPPANVDQLAALHDR